ncbi:TrkH family potassium uptake protein [Psychroflexus sp. ALD_RP9]|uniref:TrkH family potassium uptake protein n=1 Tax=Psychroflexus sp. ALD_RP9 TaxID=2777186 RepID=UPI001A90BE9A|nr:TrkH family potassium uptake protein [Psychroflexus sp. ALD_RP9]QSS96826.1 TrkH family potassium uptake protein [Psychroflexus sp. ALD_RP9]
MYSINYKIVFHTLGLILIFNGAFMLIPTLTSWYYGEAETLGIASAAITTLFVGFLIMFVTRFHDKSIQQKEGYLIVTFSWIFMVISGMLPYIFTKSIPQITDAFFETMSGYTTTGSSILSDIEVLPKGILLWRSLTHWIGGMGIIVLAVAIFPLFGIGGMQLFSAEAPGPSADKLKPRIADTAKRLWLIYLGYTIVEAILLNIAGMTLFDAVNHALSTLSTGGFSTKNESLAYWNDQPMIQYIIILFMFLAGTNFVVSYYGFKLNFKKVLANEEFKVFTIFVSVFTILATLLIYFQADVSLSSVHHPEVLGAFESAFRHAIFQVLAIITTTGFVSADYTMWVPFLTVMFFGLFFLGGSAGSTSGGVKVVRHLIMIKNGILEFKRILHPNAVLPVRYAKRAVNSQIVYNILGFFILYMLSFIIGAVVLGALGLNLETAIGGAASSLGNVGPAFGKLGPVDNYSALPSAAKWWCSFLMLIGRLELFTVLIILTPFFWRDR